eukprot:11837516-Heterocapsa_arctica.AAC.1
MTVWPVGKQATRDILMIEDGMVDVSEQVSGDGFEAQSGRSDAEVVAREGERRRRRDGLGEGERRRRPSRRRMD